eukprot:TRINITY_DN43865_c0_g1_i1.p1 TRINITY_DN43865_c0_g1~~TRINITY_DN43865_c0_g1_i1.p1  ORF type:complete len:860 (+),score=224.71 TRINITY_DN43865_c0_g1_i1:49-2628(+)
MAPAVTTPLPKVFDTTCWEIGDRDSLPQAGLLDAGQLGCADRMLAQAADPELSETKRSACRLAAEGDRLLLRGNLEEGQRAAEESLQLFREVRDVEGVIEAVRLVILAQRAKGSLKDAHHTAYNEYQLFVSQGAKTGEAKMLLMLANLNYDKRGSNNRERAMQWALESRRLFAETGNYKFEAQSLLAIINCIMKQRGDRRRAAEETQQLVAAAVPLFRAAGDFRGEGAAMHCLACARSLMHAWEAAASAGRIAADLFRKAEVPKLVAFELHCVACWLLLDDDAEQAIEVAEESYDLYLQESQVATIEEAGTLQTLVKAYVLAKDYEKAVSTAQEALERFEESGLKSGEAAALEMLSLGLAQQGDLGKAVKYAKQQVETLREIGNRVHEARALRTVCRIWALAGNLDAALKSAREAAFIYQELGLVSEHATTMQLISDCQLQCGAPEDSWKSAEEACDLFKGAGDHEHEAAALLQACNAAAAQENREEALGYATKAQDAAIAAGNSHYEGLAYHTEAIIRLEAGEYAKTNKAAKKAVILARQNGDKSQEVACLVLMVTAHLSKLEGMAEGTGKAAADADPERFEKASKLAQDAHLAAKRLGDAKTLGTSLYALSRVQAAAGKHEDAIAKARAGLDKFQEAEDTVNVVAMYSAIASTYLSIRNFEEAREAAESSIWICQQVGQRDLEEKGWIILDRIKEAEEEMKRARAPPPVQVQQDEVPTAIAGTPMLSQAMPQPQATAPQMGGAMPQALASRPVPGNLDMSQVPKLELGQALDLSIVQGQVIAAAQAMLGAEEELETDIPLMELGLTSGMAVILRDILHNMLPGLPLPVTLIFDYPSIEAISELIVETANKAAKKLAG